jgi:hypothetical protein
MIVRIPQTTLFRSCNWCAQRRQKHHILWILLDDVLEAFVQEACHGSVMRGAAMLRRRDEFQLKENGGEKKDWKGKRQSSAPPQDEAMVIEASSMSCA